MICLCEHLTVWGYVTMLHSIEIAVCIAMFDCYVDY